MKILAKTKKDVDKIAKELTSTIGKPATVALYGDLGVGKTFFASCLINELLKRDGLPPETATSPTFNLVKIYNLKNFSIYHYDLYRLRKLEEIYELDFEEAQKNVMIIEWPELAEKLLPKDAIKIKITFSGENNRVFELT
ncbi:MAG: tRNA (adenosine(37)-N6)-threonylcarbamoyltransferase complex ATPase subunit type 1 TsaE [Rickettsiales bacterium]|jgi:tRNA threonylcarbamoyladenosine biosynthesis protein TsaE|nr:tRNA (adenosine(37)-N6)-threonylcarbamoyltransferase complex ATPase subunit type 1 TsaE [Rickettsiales bacterium]